MCAWARRFSGSGDASARIRATRWLAMTLNRLFERDRHFSDQAEIRLEHIARLNRQRRVAGAWGHELARFKRHAKLPQFIGEPRQGTPGVAEHVLAMTDELSTP